MSFRIVLVFAAGTAIAVPTLLSAHRGSAVAGFNALIQTPIGAFAPGAPAHA